ncbi:MAG TPA: hypothetical protein VNJ03_10055 [Vicinamibacterales bacterium]|nr:hypothetical protein [Vicinamibacterales bacterium]
MLQPARLLHGPPFPERDRELRGYVDPSALMRLGGGQHSAHQVSPDQQELSVPVDVAPLQPDLFAEAQAGAKRQQDPGVPPREVLAGRRDKQARLLARQRLHHRLRLVATTEIAPKT